MRGLPTLSYGPWSTREPLFLQYTNSLKKPNKIVILLREKKLNENFVFNSNNSITFAAQTPSFCASRGADSCQ